MPSNEFEASGTKSAFADCVGRCGIKCATGRFGNSGLPKQARQVGFLKREGHEVGRIARRREKADSSTSLGMTGYVMAGVTVIGGSVSSEIRSGLTPALSPGRGSGCHWDWGGLGTKERPMQVTTWKVECPRHQALQIVVPAQEHPRAASACWR